MSSSDCACAARVVSAGGPFAALCKAARMLGAKSSVSAASASPALALASSFRRARSFDNFFTLECMSCINAAARGASDCMRSSLLAVASWSLRRAQSSSERDARARSRVSSSSRKDAAARSASPCASTAASRSFRAASSSFSRVASSALLRASCGRMTASSAETAAHSLRSRELASSLASIDVRTSFAASSSA